jgi:hypothetical protein
VYASALDFAGLYTFPSPLSKVPVGAALQADNVTANKDGSAEGRRGLARKGSSFGFSAGTYITQWFGYQNHLLANDSAGGLWYDTSSDVSLTWSQFTGTFLPPTNFSGAKIRGVEANKNLFLTTSAGVKKMPAYNSTPINAGAPPALDGTASLAGAGTGFLGASEQCAYQIVFGYFDVNGNLILGNPSERILSVNPGVTSDNITLVFTVPQGLSTTWFYQIYRTPQTIYSATPALNVPPGAEPQLVTQQQLTAGQIASLSVTYTDVTPEELLGAALYTNPSQQGAFQTNDRPPLCADMCVFNQMMFYANCSTLQSMTFSLISVGSPNGIQINDTIVVNGITFTAKAAQANLSKQFAVYSSGTVSQNIDTTARNLIQCINANAATTNVYAIYLSGYNSLPGLIELQGVSLSVAKFYVTSSRGGAFSPILPPSGTSFGSSNDITPNGFYASKVGQPEAVPSVNLNFVGGGDQPIYRVLPLRDRVIVIKSDGVFVVTGSTPSTLNITLLDSTIICIAPESAKLLNNSVYCMSNQGVVSITESGVTIQSRAIEGDIISLTGTVPNFSSLTHAISYESERLYILCTPSIESDTSSTQEWCYNWVTNAWTRWTVDMAAGFVNPFDNKLYVSRPIADSLSNFNYAYQERKGYVNDDFLDDQFSATITGVDATGLIVSLASIPTGLVAGWGLEQTIDGILYVAIITGFDAGASTVTVDFQNSTTPGTLIPWANGAAYVDVPIQINYTSAPITAGFPHFMKDWGRVNLWFNSGNFQQMITGFISDIEGTSPFPVTIQSIPTYGFGAGGFNQSPFGGKINTSQVVQTMVPNQLSKARWIEVLISLSFPKSHFLFLGSTLSYEIISDATG